MADRIADDDVVALLTDAGVLDAEAIVEIERSPAAWGTSVVLLIRTEARRLVFKASAKGAGTAGEIAACAAARAAGVRAPEVLARGRSTSVPGGVWSVLAWMDGAWGDEAPPVVWQEVGAELARLHHVPREGWGYLRADGRGTSERWPTWLLGQAADGLARLPEPRRAAATTALERGLHGASSPPRPVLLHGDLNPHEIRWRDDRLVGILDFGDATAGDPAYELATMALGGPTFALADELLPRVLAGYGPTPEVERRLADVLPLYRLVSALRNLDWSHRHAMPADWITRLEGSIASLV